MNKPKNIAIIGAGLVGSLLSIYLARRGYQISIFERRPDMRKGNADGGRSINLALSTRGILALEDVGLAEALKKVAIPMHGRMMHDPKGNLTFLAYGKEGQFINSISRSNLNIVLIEEAERLGVKIFFEQRCTNVDLEKTELTLQTLATVESTSSTRSFDVIIGADGAFSAVRGAMQITDRFNFSQHFIEHGYKELNIPPDRSSGLERNALHIWPRERYMMIALPNPDNSFTCTLFFPFEGTPSFATLSNDAEIMKFFSEVFSDVAPRMPELLEDFHFNPTSSLVTIRCFPWVKNNTVLIGDAAHGIVPFFGQGMNAGFEDCRILNRLLNQHHDDWSVVLPLFQQMRKTDTDAIAQLAFDNFVEMRDLVGDPEFLLRKKIEARLHQLYPEKWIPLYSMVTFSPHIRYSQAYETGMKQRQIMDEVMRRPGIMSDWEQLDFEGIVKRLDNSPS
jgi:kynurenine 3-monooxygenase